MPHIIPDKMLTMMDPETRAALGKAGKTAEELILSAHVKKEKTLQDLLQSLLKLRGIRPISVAFGKRSRITVGCPDIIFCYIGVPVMWEVKYGDGKLSQDQADLHSELRVNGWHIFIVRTCEEGKQILNDIKNGNIT